MRLTEKFGSSGTFFSTEKLYAKEPVVSVLISRLTPAKRPPDCRLKCLENNKIVLFVHNNHTVLSAQIVDILGVIVMVVHLL